MVIIAGMPVKGSVAKKLDKYMPDEEDHKYGGPHQKPPHHKHKKMRCCKIVKAILISLVGAHFFFIKKL